MRTQITHRSETPAPDITIHLDDETGISCSTSNAVPQSPSYAVIRLGKEATIFADEAEVKRLHDVLGEWLAGRVPQTVPEHVAAWGPEISEDEIRHTLDIEGTDHLWR